jgi:hypothetical protein
MRGQPPACAHARLIEPREDRRMARHASLTIAVALPAVAIGLALIFAVGGTAADAVGALACAVGLAALARAAVALAAGDADEPRM